MVKARYGIGMLALAVLALGCETMQSQSGATKGALVGGALGAGAGAILGNQTDNAGAGTAIGAGLGALSGAVIGHAIDSKDKAAATQSYPAANTPTSSTALAQFCPVGGERYTSDVRYCPIHGVELKPVQ